MSGRRTAKAPASPLSFIGTGVSYIALCVAALAALALVVIPMVTGSQTYSVLTSSMAPKYAPGTFLVVKPVPFNELKVGDIITYQIDSGSPTVITHRISAVSAEQSGEVVFITKGDNNDLPDEAPVREVQVKGKLSYAVPFVGFAANSLGNSDRGAMAQWGAVALMGYGVISMVRGALAKKRNNDAGTEDSEGHGPEADDDGFLFPGFGASTEWEAELPHEDGLISDDLILTDCDGCDHPHDRVHAHDRFTDRKHATV